jgi:hypothetical protein
MSKGVNMLNLLNPPKSDGHKVIENTVHGPVIYCPKIGDTITGNYTSNGIYCPHCKKHIH